MRHVVWVRTERMGGRAQGDGVGEPCRGRAPGEADEGDGPVRLTAADFDIDVTARRAAVCPAGHEAVSEYEMKTLPSEWRCTSPGRCVNPARCVPGVL